MGPELQSRGQSHLEDTDKVLVRVCKELLLLEAQEDNMCQLMNELTAVDDSLVAHLHYHDAHVCYSLHHKSLQAMYM